VTRCGAGNVPTYSAQPVAADIELAGIVADDHCVAEQAVRLGVLTTPSRHR
jgi:hypothetical protein